uniref:Uncharacterized protein n=1 Tax=Oryza meridionalis TaxID=40149 RepID=A0A0E0DNU6_9ORYZ
MAAWIEAKTVVTALLAFQIGGDRGGSGISADGALPVMGRAKGGRWQTAKAFIAAASRCRSCNGFGTKGGGMVAKGNRDSSSVSSHLSSLMGDCCSWSTRRRDGGLGTVE